MALDTNEVEIEDMKKGSLSEQCKLYKGKVKGQTITMHTYTLQPIYP